jgi:hypothetical protein
MGREEFDHLFLIAEGVQISPLGSKVTVDAGISALSDEGDSPEGLHAL